MVVIKIKKITFIIKNNWDEDLINSIKFNYDIDNQYEILINNFDIDKINTEFITFLELNSDEYAIYNTVILDDILNMIDDSYDKYYLPSLFETSKYYFDKIEETDNSCIIKTSSYKNNIYKNIKKIDCDWFFIKRKYKEDDDKCITE